MRSEQFLSCKVLDVQGSKARPNVYELNIASPLYQPEIVILIRDYIG